MKCIKCQVKTNIGKTINDIVFLCIECYKEWSRIYKRNGGDSKGLANSKWNQAWMEFMSDAVIEIEAEVVVFT